MGAKGVQIFTIIVVIMMVVWQRFFIVQGLMNVKALEMKGIHDYKQ